jgi:hypothetical protein
MFIDLKKKKRPTRHDVGKTENSYPHYRVRVTLKSTELLNSALIRRSSAFDYHGVSGFRNLEFDPATCRHIRTYITYSYFLYFKVELRTVIIHNVVYYHLSYTVI